MLTRLQAINAMLTPVGEAVVLTEVAGASDVSNASEVLDAETLKTLAKGWSFNTDKSLKYVPDVAGKIAVPLDVMHIDPVDPTLDVVQRGPWLYDRTNHTYVFTAPVEVNVILAFPFEAIPYHVQRQIVAQAAKAYQRGYVGSTQLDQFAQEERMEAGADAADAESDVDDYNILNNPDLWYLRRRTGYRGF